jgi:hypothetical protein
MKKLLTAALCLTSIGAWADTTYVLDLTGSGVWTPYCGVCGDPPLPPYPGPEPETWDGTLTITLTSDSDGVFSGQSLSAEFESNLMDISSDLFAFSGGATATVQDGQVTSFMANLWFPNATYYKVNFSGLSANYEISNAWCHHCGNGFGSGTLAPVPEPSTWALMLGGLALLGVAHLRFAAGARTNLARGLTSST